MVGHSYFGRFLRQLLPFVLGAVLLYTLWRKDMGRDHTPRFSGLAELLAACSVGLVIGFYDGFLGPVRVAFLSSCWCAGWATTFKCLGGS